MLWRTGLFRTPMQLLGHFLINWSEQEISLIQEELTQEVKEVANVECLTADQQRTLEENDETNHDSEQGTREDGQKFLASLQESKVTELDA